MLERVFKGLPNRVRRSYSGGRLLDEWWGVESAQDSFYPESWIASTTLAKNPGMPPVHGEGLTYVRDASGQSHSLKQLLECHGEAMLGSRHLERLGGELGFLAKFLDSAVRLQLQVHPTSEFARSRMGEPFGKLEVYYVLSVRNPEDAFIYLGFQHSPGRESWRNLIEQQDLKAMEACFKPISVKPGDVWMVPGGIPHAIGPGVMMVELMEPSDLVVRCEFERDGMVVPREARFMGKDLDFCLDVFDYREFSPDEVERLFKLKPIPVATCDSIEIERLTRPDATPCFQAYRIKTVQSASVGWGEHLGFWIQTEGEAKLGSSGEYVDLGSGDTAFIPAKVTSMELYPKKNKSVEGLLVLPGNMEPQFTTQTIG